MKVRDQRKDHNGQDEVHHRPGQGDQHALPPWLRVEVAGIAARLRHRFRLRGRGLDHLHLGLAGHLDVAAQRQHADLVVGPVVHPSEQTLAHADGMAELVHQHHDAEDDEEVDGDDQEMRNVQRSPQVNGRTVAPSDKDHTSS